MLDGQPVGVVEATRVFDLPAGRTPAPTSFYPWWLPATAATVLAWSSTDFSANATFASRRWISRLGKVPNINSSSVLENGWPVLIVDVEDLIRSIDNMLAGRRLGRLAAQEVKKQVRAPKRILIVDDSITVRELERQLLENRGYTVDVAVDGVDGWNAVRSAHYDLVVSDIDMPRMDGIQLVQHIKEMPGSRRSRW